MSKRFTITRPGDGTNVPVGNKNNKQPGAGAFKITRHVKTEHPTYAEKTVRCPIPVGITFEKVKPSSSSSKYKMVYDDALSFVEYANIETNKGFAGILPWYNYTCTEIGTPLIIPYAGAYDVDLKAEALSEYIHPTWIDRFSNAAVNSECEITITPYTGTLQLPDSGPGTIYASGGNLTTMDATALPGISPFTLKGTMQKLKSIETFDSSCSGTVPFIEFAEDGISRSVPFIPVYTHYPPDASTSYDEYGHSMITSLARVLTADLTLVDEDNIASFDAFIDEMDNAGYLNGINIDLPGPKVGFNKCDEAWDMNQYSFALFAVDITFTEVDPGVVQENEERRSWKLIHKDDKGIGHNIGTSSQTIENGDFETDPNVAEKVFPAEYDEFGNLIRPAQAEYCAENGVQKVVKNRPKIDRTIATEFASEN